MKIKLKSIPPEPLPVKKTVCVEFSPREAYLLTILIGNLRPDTINETLKIYGNRAPGNLFNHPDVVRDISGEDKIFALAFYDDMMSLLKKNFK